MAELWKVDHDLADHQERRSGLERLLMDKSIAQTRFNEQYSAIEKAISELKNRQQKLETSLGAESPNTGSVPERWPILWGSLGLPDRHRFISAFVGRVTISRDEIEFTYRLPEPSARKDEPRPQ